MPKISDLPVAASVQDTALIPVVAVGSPNVTQRATAAQVRAGLFPSSGGTITGAVTITSGGLTVDAGGIDVAGDSSISGGTMTLSSGGGWSSSNVGKQLLLTTPAAASNPGIGITDGNGTNLLAMYNDVGTLTFAAMPAYSDGATAATSIVNMTKGAVAVTGTFGVTGASTLTGVVTAGAAIRLANAQAIQMKDFGGTYRSTLATDASSNTILFNGGGGAGGSLVFSSSTGAVWLTMSDAGVFGIAGAGILTIQANATTGKQVPNYSQFNPTTGTTGANAGPGGFLEKWGTVTTAGGGSGAVTFSVAFPTAADNIRLTPINANGIAAYVASGATAAGFTAVTFDTLTQSGSGPFSVFWHAIGH